MPQKWLFGGNINHTQVCGRFFFSSNLCACGFTMLTFFPPCFSTMSVLSGKWSSWGVLEPPPLGIVQLSPRQASFTLPLHRHQPSGRKKGEVITWPFEVSHLDTRQTRHQLAVHQGLAIEAIQTFVSKSTALQICKESHWRASWPNVAHQWIFFSLPNNSHCSEFVSRHPEMLVC